MSENKPKRRGGRPPGIPKTGGRKPGSQNMKQRALAELLQEAHPGYDPVRALADIANNPRIDLAIRVRCHMEVAKYVRPALKSVEVRAVDDEPGMATRLVINVVKPGEGDDGKAGI